MITDKLFLVCSMFPNLKLNLASCFLVSPLWTECALSCEGIAASRTHLSNKWIPSHLRRSFPACAAPIYHLATSLLPALEKDHFNFKLVLFSFKALKVPYYATRCESTFIVNVQWHSMTMTHGILLFSGVATNSVQQHKQRSGLR